MDFICIIIFFNFVFLGRFELLRNLCLRKRCSDRFRIFCKVARYYENTSKKLISTIANIFGNPLKQLITSHTFNILLNVILKNGVESSEFLPISLFQSNINLFIFYSKFSQKFIFFFLFKIYYYSFFYFFIFIDTILANSFY